MGRKRVEDLGRQRQTDAENQRTHYLYRIFDKDGDVLYIGCTEDVEGRMQRHKSFLPRPDRQWDMFNRIDHWTSERYPNKLAARTAERAAIAAENPPYNTQHRKVPEDAA